jgi:dipeptide/tripeptide permease
VSNATDCAVTLLLTFRFIVIVANAWVSDRRGRRPEHILFGLALVAIGFIILATVKESVGGRYVGILLMGLCRHPGLVHR